MAPSLDLALMVWLSPSFPVGAFAYSHGLESAVDGGVVAKAETLGGWLLDLLTRGSIRTDVILLAEAFRATVAQDAEKFAEVNQLALALASSTERRLETTAQGAAFLRAARAAWPDPTLDFVAKTVDGDIAFPCAVAAAAARFAPEYNALPRIARAYALNFVANLVSAALRLGAVGQTDGQRVIAASLDAVAALGELAQRATLEDLGACCLGAELAAMRHETQYSRLFRS